MARRPRYRPWLRRPQRKADGGWSLLIPAVLGIGLALLCIRAFDAGVRPLVEEIAKDRAKNAVTAIVNDAVMRTLETEAVAYSDLVTLQTDSQGRITALTTSTLRMNTLRTEILEDIVTQVDQLDSVELGIPLGNLTGLVSLSEQGPRLPVQVYSVAAAEADFRNAFTSAGINQTLHQVFLMVTVEIKLLVPGGTVGTTAEASVCMAETVIVGEVPQTYLQMG